MAHIDVAEGTGSPRRPRWIRIREYPAHRGLHHPEFATRRPRQILQQSSRRSTTMKRNGKPLVAGVGCQSTHVDLRRSSQQTKFRAIQPKNRQVSLVYRCWNFAVRVPFRLTFADPRRAFQAAILIHMSLQQHEIGPEARPPRRPRNRVGQGARKVPRPFPLIFRISRGGRWARHARQRGRVRVGLAHGVEGGPGRPDSGLQVLEPEVPHGAVQ